ncbi:hypothetical protein GCM10023205_64210 [Yinghuangia aomiensis]|uniref:Uncharacterized protein n=1 Tax=Yinghuangia aomiensis TaxID=676205 RepID=A0ABP9I1F7_9ACTN
MGWFWFLLLVAVVCGFIGVLAKGLIWLLVVGVVIFAGVLVVAGLRFRGRSPRRGRP